MVAALYRRYRPEAFSEMIGQSQVTEPLMTALRTGRVGHAYLFSGPRGCGKTTSARILARCLNCTQGPTDTPCGECESCVELSREGGGSLDVVEIDAASHGGVDDARDLRERAAFAPARDNFKIFIIDEAHMVSSQGFNALLKIVEEPPPHVKFIFATTEPDKVIGTIRSRTHHYPFRLIAPGTLIDYVQQLCDSESVQVEPGVLPLVVRAGGGSVRDTLSILDQLIAGSEGDLVAAERAAGLLGFTSAEVLDEVVVALGARDAAGAFTATDRVIQTGQDPRRFVEDLLERLRDLIVVGATTVDGAAAVFRGVPQDQLTRMFEQAQGFGHGELSRVADIAAEALDSMTGATAPRLQLELMIARALVELGSGDPAVAPTAPSSEQISPISTGSMSGGASQPSAERVPPVERVETKEPPQENQPNAAQTAASVRDFLKEDTAGSRPVAESHPNAAPASFGRPISDVLSRDDIEGIGGSGAFQAAPEAPSEPPAKSAVTQTQPDPAPVGEPSSADVASGSSETVSDAANSEAVDSGAPTLDDLLELWPELLEELQQVGDAAFEAVRAITPVSLEGEVLGVGVPSRAELDAFKAAGADPLREAILAATGITVKYMPRQVARAPREEAQAPQQGDHDTEEPHRGAAAENRGIDAPNLENLREDPVSRAEAKLSVFGPPQPAPGWSEPPPQEPKPEPEPEPEPQPEAEHEAPEASAVDPAALRRAPLGQHTAPVADAPSTKDDEVVAPSSAEVAEWHTAREAMLRSERLDPNRDADEPPAPPEPASPEASASAPEPQKTAPVFTRYGEAVVREVLGARFIEERPLPTESQG